MDNFYEKSLEHAWKYFEIHSQQRMSIFNFFLGATGLVSTGIGICIQQGGDYHYLSFALSVFLVFSSLNRSLRSVNENLFGSGKGGEKFFQRFHFIPPAHTSTAIFPALNILQAMYKLQVW